VFVPQLFMSTVVGECKYMRVVPAKMRILIDQEPWPPVDVYIYIYVYAYVNVSVYVYAFIYIYINKQIHMSICPRPVGVRACVFAGFGPKPFSRF
jgi:hypothetical protein